MLTEIFILNSRFDPSKTGARNIVELVNELGFTAAVVSKVRSVQWSIVLIVIIPPRRTVWREYSIIRLK